VASFFLFLEKWRSSPLAYPADFTLWVLTQAEPNGVLHSGLGAFARLNNSRTDRCSICLPGRDERLSWFGCLACWLVIHLYKRDLF